MARPGRIERGRLGARPPAASLLHDDSPEGEWVRRQQGKSTRAIVRILDQFRKARRRGEPLRPPPPVIDLGPADTPETSIPEGR